MRASCALAALSALAVTCYVGVAGAWSSAPPYEAPTFVAPPDDGVVLNSLLEGSGYGGTVNSNWTDATSGNFCGGQEKELMLVKNEHSHFSVLRGPTPWATHAFDLGDPERHPWRAVAAGNLDADTYDEYVAVRKVTASSVVDIFVLGADPSTCALQVQASAAIGNPANSEWVDVAVGNFTGAGNQVAMLKNEHSNLTIAAVTGGTLTPVHSSDLNSDPARPWKAVAAGDLDGDGRDELVLARQVSGGVGSTVLVYKWIGSTFQLLATSTFGNTGNSDWSGMAVGDFNADGRAAIALVKNSHSNFAVLDLPGGANSLRVLSTSDLDSAGGQDWRALTASDWIGGDNGAKELIAFRRTQGEYRTNLFVYGNAFHRVSRDTGLMNTRAQWHQVRAPSDATPEQLAAYFDRIKAGLAETYTNTANWSVFQPPDYNHLVKFLQATRDFNVNGRQLRVWVTLLPRFIDSRCSSQPEDSPDTPWNELSFFDETRGGFCRDYLGWGSVLGLLAKEYPHFVAVNIDDFAHHPEEYPGDYLAQFQSRLREQAPWLSFVPTGYYGDFDGGRSPDLTRMFDSLLFYFRNEAQGLCLTEPCGSASIDNLPAEVSFMSARLPAGRKLQLGTYWVPLRSPEPDEIPSITYSHDLTRAGVDLPQLDGVTAYAMDGILLDRVLTLPDPPGCDASNYLDTTYCALKDAFGPVVDAADAAPADYDGDGQADLSFKTDEGAWFIDLSGKGLLSWDVVRTGYGDGRCAPVPADYDGDGAADLSVKCTWGFWNIDHASSPLDGWNVSRGGYGDGTCIPAPADYDGDGRTDFSVKCASGFWGIDYASSPQDGWNMTRQGYGDASCIPVPADYDGDGRADLSVKCASGFWGIDHASSPQDGWNVTRTGYGNASCIPVPADYDGDGRADLSVKCGDGSWFIDYASSPQDGWNVIVGGYGGASTPIPRDYNGDGKADLSVTDGSRRWYIDYAGVGSGVNGFGSWDAIFSW